MGHKTGSRAAGSPKHSAGTKNSESNAFSACPTFAFDAQTMSLCCMCLAIGLFVGAAMGAAACPDPDVFGFMSWPVAYARALRTLVWDCKSATQALQDASGLPIYTASSGASLFGIGVVSKALMLSMSRNRRQSLAS